MKKILFLIHDMGQGGAEKVLINLVNHLDRSKFDISVTALFGGGVNEKFLKPDIHFRAVFPKNIRGNSHAMKLLSPAQLHAMCVKEHYDVEVSYLEGPSARVISGCPSSDTMLIGWIHCTMHSQKDVAASFRSYREAQDCYNRMDRLVFVSEDVRTQFQKYCPCRVPCLVRHNTNESDAIICKSKEAVFPVESDSDQKCFRWCGMGKLVPNKGFDRMIRIQKKLAEDGYAAQLWILGEGEERENLKRLVSELSLEDSVRFLGYQTNPYRYLAQCDLFACASHSEGFSTAATEALLLGIPVCTVEVSGMKEMLGAENEYGIITENDENALYLGIKELMEHPEQLAYYRQKAEERGKMFSTEHTVHEVERLLCGEE